MTNDLQLCPACGHRYGTWLGRCPRCDTAAADSSVPQSLDALRTEVAHLREQVESERERERARAELLAREESEREERTELQKERAQLQAELAELAAVEGDADGASSPAHEQQQATEQRPNQQPDLQQCPTCSHQYGLWLRACPKCSTPAQGTVTSTPAPDESGHTSPPGDIPAPEPRSAPARATRERPRQPVAAAAPASRSTAATVGGAILIAVGALLVLVQVVGGLTQMATGAGSGDLFSIALFLGLGIGMLVWGRALLRRR